MKTKDLGDVGHYDGHVLDTCWTMLDNLPEATKVLFSFATCIFGSMLDDVPETKKCGIPCNMCVWQLTAPGL